MSKLDTAPFKIHDRVRWVTSIGTGQKLEKRGVISDGYFQPKTKLRREGWRLLIKKESADDEKTHLEKYFDELETC